MKPLTYNLRLGQSVWAVVDENIAGGEILINFSGDLLRVANESGRFFRSGERVQLRVAALSPLRFRLVLPRCTPQPRFERTI